MDRDSKEYVISPPAETLKNTCEKLGRVLQVVQFFQNREESGHSGLHETSLSAATTDLGLHGWKCTDKDIREGALLYKTFWTTQKSDPPPGYSSEKIHALKFSSLQYLITEMELVAESPSKRTWEMINFQNNPNPISWLRSARSETELDADDKPETLPNEGLLQPDEEMNKHALAINLAMESDRPGAIHYLMMWERILDPYFRISKN